MREVWLGIMLAWTPSMIVLALALLDIGEDVEQPVIGGD